MCVPQTACPRCHLATPEWKRDCIHCGFVRVTDGPENVHPQGVATIGRTYPTGTNPRYLN